MAGGAAAGSGAPGGTTGEVAGATRTYTDTSGIEHTATLQPDGTWTSDEGRTVDLDKTDAARREAQRDREISRADQERSIAKDQAKADADRKQLDDIRKQTAQNAKAPADYKTMVGQNQEMAKTTADMYKGHADTINTCVNRTENVVTTADFGVNVLGTMTGATIIKTGYTIGKNIGKNMSDSYQKKESLFKGAVRGGLEAGYDLGFDKLKKSLPKGPGNWDFKPSDSSILTPLGNGVASAGQSQAVKTLVKDPIKDLAKKGSDKVLGSTIGKFK